MGSAPVMVTPATVEDEKDDDPTKALRRVVVAGDVTIDWKLARTRRLLDGGTAR